MKALIIEDEPMARASLVRLLGRSHPDVKVIGELPSVRAAVEWFRNPQNEADIVFMDVELSDGNCFEIFRQVEVRGNVIMTTAYDNYAVKAFEVGGIDYLLKPVEPEALARAVGRAKEGIMRLDVEKLAGMLAKSSGAPEYKKRIIVRFNDKIVPVETSNVAYFYAEVKSVYVVTCDGTPYIVDMTLDEIMEQIDPSHFFRVSRRCIVSVDAIRSVTKQAGGRLLIEVVPRASFDVTVSRSRSDDFLSWMER